MAALKISELLRETADVFLSYDEFDRGDTSEFICHALAMAANGRHEIGSEEEGAVKFLESLGMPLSGDGFSFWGVKSEGERTLTDVRIARGEDRQQVRYAWLHLAADIAEEEGL